ncbi:hypothetical protein [Streptomyces jeddahensis]|uniref:hypothetical protein n=1 Tax=Streptomyces jeddahensis TaxID=1716141 RepID=UPI0012FFA8B6|nr:hypothetical protein [Streptomyces jeddahensis]
MISQMAAPKVTEVPFLAFLDEERPLRTDAIAHLAVHRHDHRRRIDVRRRTHSMSSNPPRSPTIVGRAVLKTKPTLGGP